MGYAVDFSVGKQRRISTPKEALRLALISLIRLLIYYRVRFQSDLKPGGEGEMPHWVMVQ
jgi:hypothetical protein